MRIPRRLAVSLLVAIVAALASSGGRAQVSGVQFYGIGDLSGGGVNSIVQEATQVGNTVYAVGASTQTASVAPPGISNLDTAVIWDSQSSALTIIPDLATFNPPPTTANAVVYAITPDAQYIGGRLRNNASSPSTSNAFRALRLLGSLRVVPGFQAVDISDASNTPATIVYGQQSGGSATVNNSRAVRSDVSAVTTTSVQVPLLTPAAITPNGPCSSSAPTCLDNLPAYRGMSADGSVLVGTAFTGGFTGLQNQYQTTNGLAFRWQFNQASVTEIPRPSGGTWSSAIAISTDGNLTLAGGNSATYPLGEVWIHNYSAGTIQELGSPNTAFTPRLWGGMTADGTVVGVTFTGGSPLQGATLSAQPTQYAYLHNAHGWFHLANVLTAQGVDLWASGWDSTSMILTGIRTVDTDNNGTDDVDLVFGQGRRHNADGSPGGPEGFVASFPVGVLAGYELPTPAPVANRTLVGAWAMGADPNNPLSVIVFLSDGTYYTTTSRGAAGYANATEKFERGVYTLTGGNAISFTTTEDHDGSGPSQTPTIPPVYNGLISSLNGRRSLSVNFTSADSFTVEDPSCSPVCSVFQGTRIAGGAGSVVGGWTVNNPPGFTGRFVVVLLGSNTGYKYFEIGDADSATENESEEGTYTFAPPSQLVLTPSFGSSETISATLTRDELGLFIDDTTDVTLQRIVNPSTVLPSITNATLTASGSEDAAFSFTITGINALTFGASGLPAGLSIDANTGVISGTSAVNGTYNVQVTVTNTFGDTDTKTLVLTFAPPSAGFYGIGDLPGGGGASAVRDATRVDGVIYAVGASTVNATGVTPTLDTPALWTSGGGATGALTALPYDAGVSNTNSTARSAYAITLPGLYIASQSQPISSTGTNWVRVTRSALPDPSANLNLNFGTGASSFVNLAMSDSGTVHYGQRVLNFGQPNETRVPVRYEIGSAPSLPDLVPTGKTSGVPIPRGTSNDGRIMVGMASAGPATLSTAASTVGPVTVANTVAFRYAYDPATLTGTTTVIPFLTDGTWNMPVALTTSGSQTVVIGNSNAFPSGEVYLTDGSNAITATLGTPNTGLTPRPLGGITADGVIAMTFASGLGFGPAQIAGLGIPAGGRYAYIHNSHGWFHFSSVLAAQGVDLVATGWDPTNMAVTGVRTVEGVDLVFGQGRRRTVGASGYVSGALEGFVAELPAGTLAAFNPTPTPPTDQSLVGTWLVGSDPANPQVVVSFMPDGTFVRLNINTAPTPNGFERGVYTWAGNAAGGALVTTTLYDTDGTIGGSQRNGQLGLTQIVTGDTFTFTDTNCAGCPAAVSGIRLTGTTGSIVGGWIVGNATVPDSVHMIVLLGADRGLKYFEAGDEEGGDYFGAETGTYTWDPTTHVIVPIPTGGSAGSSTITATLTRDELGLTVVETELDGDVFTTDLTRIVSPASVPPPAFGDLPALAGTTGLPFAYTVPVTHTLTVTATGLPPGLTIDEATGEIAGVPTTTGSFVVGLTAHNLFGAATGATLSIDVSAPAIVVVPSGDGVTVEPDVPAGTPDVSLTFDAVTGGGETTVAVIDPETTPELAPEPPGDFEIVLTDGGVPLYYDISTTATITGPTTICFSYAGVDFGGQTPRLFHYVNGGWVDITTSVDEATQTMCGTTTSFSPFAIFKSSAVFASGKGFYAPISPDPDYVNTARTGSTIPLKFNVTLNGVQKTTTDGLVFSVAQAATSVCTSAPQDQVDYVVQGETNLRYDTQTQQFVQTWKLPKTPGCVIARITYKDADQQVLLLTAKFSVK